MQVISDRNAVTGGCVGTLIVEGTFLWQALKMRVCQWPFVYYEMPMSR